MYEDMSDGGKVQRRTIEVLLAELRFNDVMPVFDMIFEIE